MCTILKMFQKINSYVNGRKIFENSGGGGM